MKIICFFLPLLVFASGKDNPIVSTHLGQIKGFRQTSHGGRPFSAFEGIPYAKPPIGSRRFEPPEPAEPWQGILDARFPTICAQVNTLANTAIEGTEDCLHVNVYVPRNNPSSNDKLDVIVHIHGGGFLFGHGNDYCRPRFLMDHDVIFVTFNYRLAILGFLSTEGNVVPGNMGLKDQVLVLKWIQENIKSFGGNPNSVTVTGMSAGGGSTHLHYFSELSRGLFHRGVAHSGTAFNSWALQENALENARKLANALECPMSSNQIMVECLKQRPYQQLVDKIFLFQKYLMMPIIMFAPVVEKGPNAFLTDFPYKILMKKKTLDLPLIVSQTSDEGVFIANLILADLETVNTNWTQVSPILLDFFQTLPSSKWQNISQQIRQQYFGKNQDINMANYMKLAKLLGDRYFSVDFENTVLWQAAATKSPVYYYRFSYLGDGNQQKVVSHGGEEKYFFGPKTADAKNLTMNELKMKDVMVKMLVSYARTGTPNIEGVNWQPINPNEPTYVNIAGFESENIQTKTLGNQAKREFWKSLGFLENENLGAPREEF